MLTKKHFAIFILSNIIYLIAQLLNFRFDDFLAALPVLCLAVIYYDCRKKLLTSKDISIIIGLLLSSIADVILAFRSTPAMVMASLIYMLAFSFYSSAVRAETSFNQPFREMLKIIFPMLLCLIPTLYVMEKVPKEFFFPSMIYFVFLFILLASATFRRTNSRSYFWFRLGSFLFIIVTLIEIFGSYIIKIPNGTLLIQSVYMFAQYSIFIGALKSYSFNSDR
jgi:uncharacterized membrane protein YhhN